MSGETIAMGRRENEVGIGHSGSRLAALSLVIGLMMAPAATFAATLTVTGGPGLDQGQICITGNL